MRPSFARTTFRAASSLVSRSTVRPTAFPVPRTCSTSAASNEPIVKHTIVASVTSSESLKASGSSRTNDIHQSVTHDASDSSTNSVNIVDQTSKSHTTVISPSASSVTNVAATDNISVVASEGPDLTHLNAEESSAISFQDTESDASQSSSSMGSKMQLDDTVVAPVTDAAVSETVTSGPDSASLNGNKFSEDHHTPADSPSSLSDELRAYLQRNAIRSALFHFIAALKIDGAPAIDKSVLKLILPVLGRYGWAPTALEAVNLALSREYNLETGFYNCALHAMSRSGDYDTIQSVIKRMWTLPSDSRPNATSYNYLIASFMYRGAVDRAFDVLHDMKEHMIYPTFATYHSLIAGCLRSNDPRRAFTTLNAVERQRFDIGAMTISQVLVSCANLDLPDETLQLLPRLEEAMPQYNQELHRIAEKRNAYRMASSKRTTAAERAEVRGAPCLEFGAISAILHCAFRSCRADLALAGWSLLRKHYPDVKIPATLWYCTIGALAGSGNFDKAFELLGVMRENGYTIRLKDLEAALIRPLSLDINKIDENYYRLCDKVKGAKLEDTDTDASSNELIQNSDQNLTVNSNHEATDPQETSGVENSVIQKDDTEEATTETVVNEVSLNESLRDVLAEKASSITLTQSFEELESVKSVGIDEVNCIIAACSYAGDLDRAFQTYDEVENVFGLEKNVETYVALLEGCIQVKHVRGGLRIVSEMESIGMKLDGDILHLLVRLLTRAGRAPECIDLVKKIKSEGGEVPLRTYLLLIRYFVRGDSTANAVEVIRIGEEDGYEPRTLMGRTDFNGTKKLKEALGMPKDEQGNDEDDLTTTQDEDFINEMDTASESRNEIETTETSKRSE